MVYQTTLVQYPSGRFGFVGRVDTDLPSAFDTIEEALGAMSERGYVLPHGFAVESKLLDKVKDILGFSTRQTFSRKKG